MKVVIQRVQEANVRVNNIIVANINIGSLILLGIEDADGIEDIEWLTNKICHLRIFNDDDGVMNKSLLEIDGDVLLVSQFTLHASTKKGNRPSYIKASKPSFAIPMYQQMINCLEKALNKKIKTGIFGADMQVALVNDGPVTIIIDSKNRE